MHRSRNVCAQGEESPCDSRRFRDGCGEGHEEGNREEYVSPKVVEMIFLFIFVGCILCFLVKKKRQLAYVVVSFKDWCNYRDSIAGQVRLCMVQLFWIVWVLLHVFLISLLGYFLFKMCNVDLLLLVSIEYFALEREAVSQMHPRNMDSIKRAYSNVSYGSEIELLLFMKWWAGVLHASSSWSNLWIFWEDQR